MARKKSDCKSPGVTETTWSEGEYLARQYPFPASGPACNEDGYVRGRIYICTRIRGHEGIHAAHIPGPSVIAFWE